MRALELGLGLLILLPCPSVEAQGAKSQDVNPFVNVESASWSQVALPGPKAASGTVSSRPLSRIDHDFVEQVWREICSWGIAYPQIVMAQAMMETGWLRSSYLMRRNNLFGFRRVEYLTFPHWRDSVRYYKTWQDRRLRATDANYEAFLTRIRFGADGYALRLQKLRWKRECPEAAVSPSDLTRPGPTPRDPADDEGTPQWPEPSASIPNP